ncbi:hypothetical protein SDC9_188536 [bioreactor metagenome]|uniref:Uncharacterized protein n=1 Tax=bioreactor metagenome TaxID=1076179 RepID=A0A645HR07_9ZZZZ
MGVGGASVAAAAVALVSAGSVCGAHAKMKQSPLKRTSRSNRFRILLRVLLNIDTAFVMEWSGEAFMDREYFYAGYTTV